MIKLEAVADKAKSSKLLEYFHTSTHNGPYVLEYEDLIEHLIRNNINITQYLKLLKASFLQLWILDGYAC
ncbi:hypothetical protein [Staphylothermus hellenicus]|uniref:hypothetical protein n=1 Tax=Staphylothermus hellenicus TaxID=84599 RepID=UPI0001C43D00|nr:hypothetical protein [Staphylothermus hellenicus]